MDKYRAFESAKKIRDYMLSKKLKDILLKNFLPSYHHRERILFNSTPSPDGALGMFLLLRKERFSIDKNKLNDLEKQVLDILTFDTELSKIKEETSPQRLQDKFEEYTEKILRGEFNNKVSKVNQKYMNDYDFKIDNITVEVKSDKWKYTGNVSLELLRDYNKDYDRNIGSIIKTKATFWQVYYYDKKKKEVSSEVFLTSQLKEETYKVLSNLEKFLR